MSKKKKKKKSTKIDSYTELLPIPVVKDEENKSHYINNKNQAVFRHQRRGENSTK